MSGGSVLGLSGAPLEFFFSQFEVDATAPRILFSSINQGEVIENSLRTLYENALYGGILAVLILYAFFRRLTNQMSP